MPSDVAKKYGLVDHILEKKPLEKKED